MSQLAMSIDPAGQNKDWWIWTYFGDTTADGTLMNFKCSPYAYHWFGIVFVLKNLQVMDKDIPVLAAAPGAVVTYLDTSSDRSKNNSLPDHGNFIRIQHSPQLYTYYGFLKKNSFRVKKNQIVNKGDTIAYVGSTGPAYYAKLYFRVEGSLNNNYLDPLGFECGDPPYSALLNPGPNYDTLFGII